MSKIEELTDDSFELKVLKSNVPVLVDFWAPWCGPCRMVTPVVEATAQKMNGHIRFFKLNTDENMKTAQKYGIMASPSLLVFKNGKEVDRIVGFAPQDILEEKLQNVVGASQEN
jgi:thioredoxin 1